MGKVTPTKFALVWSVVIFGIVLIMAFSKPVVPLLVEITPQETIYSLSKYPQTRSNVGSPALGTFKVHFRVSNPAAAPCAIGVWTCGYCLQWRTDNTNAYVELWGCDGNWPYGIFLDSTYLSKDAYEGELPIMVRTNTKLGNISFRMCFVPEKKEICSIDNSSKVLTNWAEGKYWSKPITITVVP